MPSPPPSNDTPWDTALVTDSPDRPPVPAELVFLMVVLALTVFFALAGVPGEPTPVVSDGSQQLRLGWMEEHNRQHVLAAPGKDAPEGSSALDRSR